MIKKTKVFYKIHDLANKHDCLVAVVGSPTPSAPYTSYNSGVVSLVMDSMESQTFFERIFLHEVCHHITWNPEWRIAQKNGTWVRDHPQVYLCEYKAEKLCRKIAAKEGWQHILDESTNMICDIVDRRSTIDPEFIDIHRLATQLWGWPYAAERIIREEKLLS